jgi:hypothetical protein
MYGPHFRCYFLHKPSDGIIVTWHFQPTQEIAEEKAWEQVEEGCRENDMEFVMSDWLLGHTELINGN